MSVIWTTRTPEQTRAHNLASERGYLLFWAAKMGIARHTWNELARANYLLAKVTSKPKTEDLDEIESVICHVRQALAEYEKKTGWVDPLDKIVLCPNELRKTESLDPWIFAEEEEHHDE
jgi:hypothetical protein